MKRDLIDSDQAPMGGRGSRRAAHVDVIASSSFGVGLPTPPKPVTAGLLFFETDSNSEAAEKDWRPTVSRFGGVRRPTPKSLAPNFRWHTPCAMILFAFLLGFTSNLSAQDNKLPFADPSKMFEQAFGEDSEADRKALEKIEVSVAEEQQLGKQILQSGLASLKESGISVESKGRDVEYLQSLVATLQPYMRNKDRYKSIKVLVARSAKIDARSCPGGTLIFFEGLLDAAGSEAALAVIVGHELSHLDRGHQLLPIKRMKLMEKSFTAPQNPAQFMQFGQGMTKLWARPFRPEDERDADQDGVAWAYAAGYDPREMTKLFQKKGAKAPNAEGMPWATFFRSHPYNHERQQAALKQYELLQKEDPKTDLSVGRENLANRFSRKQTEDAAK